MASKMIGRIVCQNEVDDIIETLFPFEAVGKRGKDVAEELFGHPAVVTDWAYHEGRYSVKFIYYEEARWVYWCHPRFRTASDAVLFKLAL